MISIDICRGIDNDINSIDDGYYMHLSISIGFVDYLLYRISG